MHVRTGAHAPVRSCAPQPQPPPPLIIALCARHLIRAPSAMHIRLPPPPLLRPKVGRSSGANFERPNQLAAHASRQLVPATHKWLRSGAKLAKGRLWARLCVRARARARACLCALGKQLQFALRNCNISVRADAAIANMSFVDIIIWQTNAAAKLKIYWRAESLVCRPFSRLIAAAECVRLRVACVCLRRLARAIQLRLSQIIYGL